MILYYGKDQEAQRINVDEYEESPLRAWDPHWIAVIACK